LFCKPRPEAKARSLLDAIDAARKHDCQVVTAAMLGTRPTFAFSRSAGLRRSGACNRAADRRPDVVDSYVSLTEVSEYAVGVPEDMRQARLYPTLPPGHGGHVLLSDVQAPRPRCRELVRTELRRPDGSHERTRDRRSQLRGRVLQLVTGSTGLDDWEWESPCSVFTRRLEDCVYSMRFDEARHVTRSLAPSTPDGRRGCGGSKWRRHR